MLSLGKLLQQQPELMRPAGPVIAHQCVSTGIHSWGKLQATTL